jgi:hypothetical protein
MVATLALTLRDIDKSMRDGTWVIPAVFLAGLLVCAYFYCTPRSYLLLDPTTRTARYVDGAQKRTLRLDQLGPIGLRTTIVAASRPRKIHYCVETAAVPVIFYVSSVRDDAVAKAKALSALLGVKVEVIPGKHEAVPIN